MYKSKISKFLLSASAIYSCIGLLALFLLKMDGSMNGSKLLESVTHALVMFSIFFPFIGVPAQFILSIVGMIKDKKVNQYLILPIIPIIVWIYIFVPYSGGA